MFKVKDKHFERNVQDDWMSRAQSYTVALKIIEC